MKKNILITGAAGNLGKATVTKFLEEGYRIHAILSPGKKSEFKNNSNLILYQADLTNELAAEEVVSKIISEYQTLDAALMLAGGYAPGAIAATGGDLLNKMFALNFFTAYHAVRPAFNQMMTQSTGGRLVFIGSRPSLVASDGKHHVAYALAKSLVFRLAEIINAEGKIKNVVSSVIVPSTIDTPENRHSMPDADFSKWVTPQAIADSIHFLVSEKGNALRDPVLKLYNNA